MDGYKELINEIPDFPKEGVSFKDISPLLANREMFRSAVIDMGRLVKNPDYWIGIDSRGFIFASALSMIFGGGVVLCRKSGKLPPPVKKMSYDLEYGKSSLAMQPYPNSVTDKPTAVIVDDVLATGGTLSAVDELARLSGYNVLDSLVLIDLLYLPRVNNFNLNVRSVVQYA